MALTSSDLKWYHPETVNTTSTNGGKRSDTEAILSESGNAISPATVAELTAGATKYHKLFLKLNNTTNEALYTTVLGLNGIDTGDDSYYVALGTGSDIQSAAEAFLSSSWACGCVLYSDATAGALTFSVNTEAGTGIETSRLFLLTDGVNTEIIPISNVSWATNVATLTIDSSYNSNNGLVNSYLASNTTGASLLDLGTITTSYVEDANPNGLTITGSITTGNYGTKTETYLVDFTSATQFRVALSSAPTLFFDSATGGTDAVTYTTFDISSQCQIVNSALGAGNYLFTIPAGYFGGTIVTSNTYTFSTTAAEKAIWVKRVVPAGSNGSLVSLPIKVRGEGV